MDKVTGNLQVGYRSAVKGMIGALTATSSGVV